jgi:hypothetical protein
LDPKRGLPVGNIGFLISNAKASTVASPLLVVRLWRDRQMSNEIPMSNVKSDRGCPPSTVKIKEQSRKHPPSLTRHDGTAMAGQAK